MRIYSELRTYDIYLFREKMIDAYSHLMSIVENALQNLESLAILILVSLVENTIRSDSHLGKRG